MFLYDDILSVVQHFGCFKVLYK